MWRSQQLVQEISYCKPQSQYHENPNYRCTYIPSLESSVILHPSCANSTVFVLKNTENQVYVTIRMQIQVYDDLPPMVILPISVTDWEKFCPGNVNSFCAASDINNIIQPQKDSPPVYRHLGSASNTDSFRGTVLVREDGSFITSFNVSHYLESNVDVALNDFREFLIQQLHQQQTTPDDARLRTELEKFIPMFETQGAGIDAIVPILNVCIKHKKAMVIGIPPPSAKDSAFTLTYGPYEHSECMSIPVLGIIHNGKQSPTKITETFYVVNNLGFNALSINDDKQRILINFDHSPTRNMEEKEIKRTDDAEILAKAAMISEEDDILNAGVADIGIKCLVRKLLNPEYKGMYGGFQPSNIDDIDFNQIFVSNLIGLDHDGSATNLSLKNIPLEAGDYYIECNKVHDLMQEEVLASEIRQMYLDINSITSQVFKELKSTSTNIYTVVEIDTNLDLNVQSRKDQAVGSTGMRAPTIVPGEFTCKIKTLARYVDGAFIVTLKGNKGNGESMQEESKDFIGNHHGMNNIGRIEFMYQVFEFILDFLKTNDMLFIFKYNYEMRTNVKEHKYYNDVLLFAKNQKEEWLSLFQK